MGCGWKCSGGDSYREQTPPNPNPNDFMILKDWSVPNYLIVLVEYHGCTNFEGKKVLVFEGVDNTAALLKATAGSLDPHFMESGPKLLARFRPTDDGIKAAIFLVSTLTVWGYHGGPK